jgi:hypothetical protein
MTDEPENEFDTALPGPPRPLVGLFNQLTDEQKRAVLAYDGPECHIATHQLSVAKGLIQKRRHVLRKLAR